MQDQKLNSSVVFKKSKSNFALAFLGLPKNQRKAMEAVYAFCRTVDDIVDESESVELAKEGLSQWRKAIDAYPEFSKALQSQVAEDLEWAVKNFPILKSDLMWIMEGVEHDLSRFRYRTFEELLVYCDGVASAVGFCCMSIFGVDRKLCESYAFATGRALQLTNILRDIASDALRGRIYIPQTWLESFQISEENILHSTYNESYLKMVNQFSEKINGYYSMAEHEKNKLPMSKIWPAEVMRKTYFQIFKKIRKQKFDVFSGKISIGKIRKAWIAISQPRG